MRIPSEERMKTVVRTTSTCVFILYALVAIFGYITFAMNLYPLEDPAGANGLILVAYGYDLQGNLLSYPPVVIGVILIILEFLLIVEK